MWRRLHCELCHVPRHRVPAGEQSHREIEGSYPSSVPAAAGLRAPGQRGAERRFPMSRVSALIAGLADKRGMTAAVVNPTSCSLGGFFVYFF